MAGFLPGSPGARRAPGRPRRCPGSACAARPVPATGPRPSPGPNRAWRCAGPPLTSSGPRPRSTCWPRSPCTPGGPGRRRTRAGEALSLARAAGRWLERGLRPGHPGGDRRAAGQVARGAATGGGLDGRHAPHRPASGESPGPCSASGIWPGCAAIPATRTPGTWRHWTSCGKSTPGRRSRAAWPGWDGWPSNWVSSAWPGSTWPRASGSAAPRAHGSAWRGALEAFAALAVQEERPEQAVRLTAAATALRETAGLPALSGARMELYLAAARRLGEPTIARLWAAGAGTARRGGGRAGAGRAATAGNHRGPADHRGDRERRLCAGHPSAGRADRA